MGWATLDLSFPAISRNSARLLFNLQSLEISAAEGLLQGTTLYGYGKYIRQDDTGNKAGGLPATDETSPVLQAAND